MKFQVGYMFRESYIPPRCRKPHVKEVEDFLEVDIPVVRPDEAPIAFIHRACWFPQRVVYRWYNGSLYKHELERRAGSKKWETITGLRRRLAAMPPYCCTKESRNEGVEYARKTAEEFIIVGGREVWSKAGEPRYEIATFGLGGNHAETALMITNHYNHNVPAGRYFSALQREEAVAEAIRVALARGDTNSVPSIKKARKINVHIPEAVKCVPQEEAGPGDSFLNKLDAITTVRDPLIAGLLAIGEVAKL